MITARTVAVLVLLCAMPVRAGDTNDEREARVLFKEGNRLLDAGDYVGALDMFRGAYQRWPNPKILLNLGTTLRQLGRNAEAADTYERFLDDPKAAAALKTEAAKSLAELTAKLGTVRIELDVADARVLVDGKEVGRSGPVVSVRVEPGEHAVLAEKAGASPAGASVRVAAGEATIVTLSLSAPTKAAAAPQASPAAPPRHRADVVTTPALAVTPLPTPSAPARTSPTLLVSARPQPSRSGPLGLLVRADVDGRLRGAVLAAGVSLDVTSWLDVGAAGLIGKRRGFWIGAKAAPGSGKLRARLVLGLPAFVVDGTVRAGVQAGVGLGWRPFPRIDVFLDLTASYFPVLPEELENLAYGPSLGMATRL